MTSAGFDLAIDGAPYDWPAATDPGRTMVVGVDEDTGTPVWAGLSLTREGGSSDVVAVGACSPEGYLDRRGAGAYVTAGADASTVMESLGSATLAEGPMIEFDTTASGLVLSYSTLDNDDKTILSQYQTISAMAGAPEWTVDVEWADAAQTAFKLVVRIRPAIGVVDANPEAVFDLPGCIADYRYSESYEAGRGATVVIASGDGEGDARFQSDTQTSGLIAGGWPRWIYRYSPGSGITSKDQLNAHAQATLRLLEQGARAWTLTAVASRAPRLGETWALGHSVAVQIERSPRHPAGASLVARAYGWDLDPAADKLTPILLEEG
ncbi:hypothetical protein ACIPY6_28790 [Streptomyces sp. NPDC090054]|uniref:hypothetical protein n=1 Tax=Streptomyces sp. NPDC090054 TaxID=3365933 RepID=UPI00381F517C